MHARILLFAVLLAGCSKASPDIAPVKRAEATEVSDSNIIPTGDAPQQRSMPESKRLNLNEITAKASAWRQLVTDEEFERQDRQFTINLGRMSEGDAAWITAISEKMKSGQDLTWDEARHALAAFGRPIEKLDYHIVRRAEEIGASEVLDRLEENSMDIRVLFRFVMLSEVDDKELRRIAILPELTADDVSTLRRIGLGESKFDQSQNR
ncbi:hypothetical protein [Planctellipticum variicoloris]|uniref:hypothetical protein n=1 Tax=Planctellipticum variicoloris TaxID=3064265 RepID=UPI0030141B74|nr:hypothetical protein SH412_000949 [Planctomycetaceae bacterium SH412]